MRRVSYLRATANENALQLDSDMDQSPVSQPPDTPETDEAGNQALRRYLIFFKFIFFGCGFYI